MIISNFRRVIQQEPGVYRLGLLSSSSLYMDFAGGFGVSLGVPSSAASLLTTTRASNGYSDDTAGNWTLFGSGVPRITNKGLLVEEARTNSIRNNSMQGAVAGSPGTRPTNWATFTLGGLTQTVVGVGTENGVDYIDLRFNGTASGTAVQINFDTIGNIAAVNGQSWTQSAFLSLVGGSWTNVTDWRFRSGQYNAGLGFLSVLDTVISAPTAAQARRTGTVATNNASTAFIHLALVITITNATAIDFTLRIGWPQLELGAFATSPIRTTSAAATRAADAITLNNFSSWFNASEGTLFVQLNGPIAATAATAHIFGLTNDASNIIQLWHWSGSPGFARFRGLSGGASQIDFATTGALSAGPHKIAGAYKLNDSNFAEDGTAKTTDTTCTVPTLTGAAIDGVNTFIRRVAYFPTRLTNAQLQAITAP